jgi:DnaJ family protein C protein 17
VEKAKAEQALQEEIERLGEEGRRRRKEKEEDLTKKTEDDWKKRQAAPSSVSATGVLGQPAIGPHDTTLRLKYKLAVHPNLTTASALAAQLAVFGPVDTGAIVLSLKVNKKQPEKAPKFATALVSFEKAGDAYACLCSAGKADRGLEGVEVSWITENEPEIIRWLRKQGKPNTPTNSLNDAEVPFASFPINLVSVCIFFRSCLRSENVMPRHPTGRPPLRNLV